MSGALVAIVTGGAQGLGAAMTRALLKNGYKVCVGDIQEKKGKEFVNELQGVHGVGSVLFCVCDVTKDSDYKDIFEVTLREFRRIDVVVNNAGIVDEYNASKTIDINLMGPIRGCKLAVKYIGKSNGGKGGMVINTASILGFLPHHSIPVYSASKHGVIGLTRSYGSQYHLEREGIIFAALCPSYADTEILDIGKVKSLAPGFVKENQEIMSPEYVADGVLKLLEDRINGSTLIVSKKSGFHYVGYQEIFNEFKL